MTSSTDSPPDDIILIVGPGKVRMAANSMGLRLSSPFFNALLGGNFREATQAEVSLPEDNADALATIIEFTKFNGMDQLPSKSEDVVGIAILTDKYDFKASRWVLQLWFRECCKSLEFAGLWHVLQAACIVDDAEAFNTISARMLLIHPNSFADLEESHHQVPHDLPVFLAERQSMLWGLVLDQFWQHQAAIFARTSASNGIAQPCTCGFLEAYRSACLDKFARTGPGSKMRRGGTINYDINSLSSVEVEDLKFTGCANPLVHSQATTDLKRRLTDLGWQLKTRGGLCIDCLKGRPTCRYQHL